MYRPGHIVGTCVLVRGSQAHREKKNCTFLTSEAVTGFFEVSEVFSLAIWLERA